MIWIPIACSKPFFIRRRSAQVVNQVVRIDHLFKSGFCPLYTIHIGTSYTGALPDSSSRVTILFSTWSKKSPLKIFSDLGFSVFLPPQSFQWLLEQRAHQWGQRLGREKMRVARMKSCGRCAPPEEFTSLTCSAVSPGINQGLIRSLKNSFFFGPKSNHCLSLSFRHSHPCLMWSWMLDFSKLFLGFL